MKKLFGLLLAVLIIYVIYIDLTVGTLENSTTQKVEAKANIETTQKSLSSSTPSFKAQVEPGQTVISIVEHQLKKPLPVSITDLIKDFQLLNSGLSPEKIQIGRAYQFPDYSN